MQIVMTCGEARIDTREIPTLLANNPLYIERVKEQMITEHSETLCVIDQAPNFHLEAISGKR